MGVRTSGVISSNGREFGKKERERESHKARSKFEIQNEKLDTSKIYGGPMRRFGGPLVAYVLYFESTIPTFPAQMPFLKRESRFLCIYKFFFIQTPSPSLPYLFTHFSFPSFHNLSMEPIKEQSATGPGKIFNSIF